MNMIPDPMRDEINRRDWSWVGDALEFGLEGALELIGGIFELLSGL